MTSYGAQKFFIVMKFILYFLSLQGLEGYASHSVTKIYS